MRSGPDAHTRSALLDAAARRFARFGPHKTTMDEVARAAGYSRATLYTHFGCKEALYSALLERVTERFVAEVERAIEAPGDARAKLRRIVEITRRTYSGNPLLLGAVTGDEEMRIAHVAAEAMREHEREVIALLARVVAEGVASGTIRAVDPEAVAYLMYQLGNLLVIRAVSGHDEFPFPQILDAMDDLIGHGLAKPRVAGRNRR
jgi:AcrR family transcriptional regulator